MAVEAGLAHEEPDRAARRVGDEPDLLPHGAHLVAGAHPGNAGNAGRRAVLAEDVADVPGIMTVADPTWGTTNYQSFWVLLPDDFPVSRDQLMERMHRAGISTRRGIMASHLEPAYAGHPHADLPVTEQLTTQSLILPLFHDLTASEQDRVVAVLREAAA